MKFAIPAILVFFVVATFWVDTTEGYCCTQGFWGGIGLTCADLTDTEWCCAHGSCNFFCCNCAGGCRKPKRDSAVGHEEVDTFVVMDKNGDGKISLPEAEEYLATSGTCGAPDSASVPIEFKKLDLNKDGFLSRAEIGAD